MQDPSEVQRIRNEARHGFTYTLPRTALNDVETLLNAYDLERCKAERYRFLLESARMWARDNGADELLVILGNHE